MGQIDIALNGYFGNEECADFINAMYYDGREVVRPDDFIEQDPVMSYIYKDNNITNGYKRERDFFRMVRASDAYYVFIGFEHQSFSDPIMPLRVTEYDVIAYRKQYTLWKRLDRKLEKKKLKRRPFKLTPVITCVIFWSDEKWSGPKSLKDMMDKDILSRIQETPLGNMILNHEIKIFTPSEQEGFDNFKSSLRVIFEALMRRNDEEALDEYLQRDLGLDQPTADVINALAGTEIIIDEKEDIVSMKSAYSKIVDRYKAEGREEGKEEGRKEGREEGREEGKEEGFANALLSLYMEDSISKSVLIKSAKSNGVLDAVLKML